MVGITFLMRMKIQRRANKNIFVEVTEPNTFNNLAIVRCAVVNTETAFPI